MAVTYYKTPLFHDVHQIYVIFAIWLELQN